MELNNAQFIDYFLKELEPLLETLINHKIRASRPKTVQERAITLFKKNPNPEDKKYSIEFMTMLQECYKVWGTSLDESIPAAEKLIERFYELLDKGSIEFTDKNVFYGQDILKMGVLDGEQVPGRVQVSQPSENKSRNVQSKNENGLNFNGQTGDKPLPGQSKLEEYLNSLLSMRAFCLEMVNNNEEIDESKSLKKLKFWLIFFKLYTWFRANTIKYTENVCYLQTL